jgi:GxxExxY protein
VTEDALNILSGRIIGACIEVHRHLGPGLLESVYADCLSHELKLRNLRFRREVVIPVTYKGMNFDTKLRADMIVEDTIILELKSVRDMLPIYEAQIMSYLSLSNLPLGLLFNFNVPLLKDGIYRLRLNYGRLSNHNLDSLLQNLPKS